MLVLILVPDKKRFENFGNRARRITKIRKTRCHCWYVHSFPILTNYLLLSLRNRIFIELARMINDRKRESNYSILTFVARGTSYLYHKNYLDKYLGEENKWVASFILVKQDQFEKYIFWATRARAIFQLVFMLFPESKRDTNQLISDSLVLNVCSTSYVTRARNTVRAKPPLYTRGENINKIPHGQIIMRIICSTFSEINNISANSLAIKKKEKGESLLYFLSNLAKLTQKKLFFNIFGVFILTFEHGLLIKIWKNLNNGEI